MDQLIRQVLDVLRGMWHRRWVGVVVAWVVALAGSVVLYKLQDRYEATARVYVDTSSLLKPLLTGLAVQPDIDQQVSMLARTLVTRPNIEKLVSRTDLDPGLLSQGAKDRLVDQITKELRFSATGRDNVYSVTFRDSDRLHAQRVVQALVSMFVESGLGNKRRDTETTRKFIDEQIASYEKRLQDAENRLKDFRLKNLSITSGSGGQDYVARTAAAAEDLAKVKLELRVAEQSRDALKRELSGEEPILLPDLVPGSLGGAGSPELEARIDLQKRQLDELLRRYTDQHPDVAQTRRMIASLEEQKRLEATARKKAAAAAGPARTPATNPVFQQIRISLMEAEANVAALQARVAEMQSRLDQLRASANRVPQVEAELAQLNRDYEVIRQSYQQMVSRRESAALTGEVDESAGLAEFRIIDPPRVGDKPVFPNRMTLVPVMLALALAAGAASAFLASQLLPTIHSARALREIGQRPVLGSISLRPTGVIVRRQRLSMVGFAGSLAALIGIYAAWLVWLAVATRV